MFVLHTKKYFVFTAVMVAIMACFLLLIVGKRHLLNQVKKALEKFRAHEISHSHKEAKLKWMARGMPTIASQLSSQIQKAQKTRRDGLIMQLKCIKYLTRQGLAIRVTMTQQKNLTKILQVGRSCKII